MECLEKNNPTQHPHHPPSRTPITTCAGATSGNNHLRMTGSDMEDKSDADGDDPGVQHNATGRRGCTRP